MQYEDRMVSIYSIINLRGNTRDWHISTYKHFHWLLNTKMWSILIQLMAVVQLLVDKGPHHNNKNTSVSGCHVYRSSRRKIIH